MTKGYFNIIIQSLDPLSQYIPKQPMSLSIKFGEAITKSEAGKWTNSYLLKIPQDIPRLTFQLTYWGTKPLNHDNQKNNQQIKNQKQQKQQKQDSKGQSQQDVLFGQCRLDVTPFFQFEGKTHIFQSDLCDQENKPTAHLKIKLTYYSANNGKLKIKILNLLLTQSISQNYKNLTIRFKLGAFVKTSPIMKDSDSWAQPLQLVILSPTLNLSIQLLSEGSLIGQFTVYNIEKEGFLTKEPKTVQNGLYWKQKSSGKIKYQVQNIL